MYPETIPLPITRSRWLCPLSEVDSASEYGHKAYHLAQAARLGLTVPPGVVLSRTAFHEFLQQNAIAGQIEAIVQQVDVHHPKSFQRAAREITEIVMGASLPGEHLDALKPLGDDLLGKTWVVRSSAVGEDSREAAFPGMLDSLLHQRSFTMLQTAIRRCWASYWSDRSLFYRASRGVELAGMGVIIQEQVSATVSGVLFTSHPSSFNAGQDERIVECCPGLADGLVAGRVTPERIVLPKRAQNSEVEPDALRSSTLLSPAQLQVLIDAGALLQESFGTPQDIEWSICDAGRLHIVQSRPITAHAEGPTGKGPLESRRSEHVTSSPGTRIVYSSANVNENYPDPVTPFLFGVASLSYYHYFRNLFVGLGCNRQRIQAMDAPLRSLIATHGGRLYYNLTNIHTVLRMCPAGNFLAGAFDQFTGTSGDTRRESEQAFRGFRLSAARRVAELVRISARVLQAIHGLPAGITRFEATVDEFAAHTGPDQLAASPEHQLLGHLRTFRDIRFHRWLSASLADAASMVSYGLLKRTLRHEFPQADQSALHNSLLVGLRNVVSAQPAVHLWKLSRKIRLDDSLKALFQGESAAAIWERIQAGKVDSHFAADFYQYLRDWGFRRSGELLLTRPNYQDDPAALLEVLRAYALQEDSAADVRFQRQEESRRSDTTQVLAVLRKRRLIACLPGLSKSTWLKWLLAWTQQSIALRERARHRQALLYGRLRGLLLALGNRLVAGGTLANREDVFFLQFEELENLLEHSRLSPHDARQRIDQRKSDFERWSRLTPPETLILSAGDTWNESEGEMPHETSVPIAPSNRLDGTAACGGRAAGPAAVLFDVSEFDRLSPGDILVAAQTDPGWGPVFLMIRGLVIERGGMLSHGAILAREYGIPTVVGVKDATQIIRHRQFLEVDGDRGIVELKS